MGKRQLPPVHVPSPGSWRQVGGTERTCEFFIRLAVVLAGIQQVQQQRQPIVIDRTDPEDQDVGKLAEEPAPSAAALNPSDIGRSRAS